MKRYFLKEPSFGYPLTDDHQDKILQIAAVRFSKTTLPLKSQGA
jgi:hypothetical protein